MLMITGQKSSFCNLYALLAFQCVLFWILGFTYGFCFANRCLWQCQIIRFIKIDVIFKETTTTVDTSNCVNYQFLFYEPYNDY